MSDSEKGEVQKIQVINLTPHAIGFKGREADEPIRVLPPVRPAVRIETRPGEKIGELQGIELFSPPIFRRIVHLPPKSQGKIFVVSQLAALAIMALDATRDDVFWPATTRQDGATRESGGVIAVARLNRAV